jgi:hypothetical protein
MSPLKSYRPTAPLVINLIALLIVLGGQAVALSGRNVVKKDDIAAGAVTARNLGRGIVTKPKLGRHAVTDSALTNKSVTGRAITPRSVHGLMLAGIFQVVATVPDADPAGPMGSDGNWTTSAATATCPSGARLLEGGITIHDSASHRAFVQSIYPSSSSASTWVGEMSTDTAGASPGQLLASCLR